MPALPKVTSQTTRTVVESEARVYTELASAYAQHNAAKLLRVAEQHANAFKNVSARWGG